MNRRVAASLLAFLFAVGMAPRVTAQRETGLAVWNVAPLYDTLPSPHYNDGDYTPRGRLHWTPERYEHKIAAIAAVLDSAAVPVAALCGVENEGVVRDIARRCNLSYTFIHRTLNRRDGLDAALLYYADSFFLSRVAAEGGQLVVEGELDGEPCVFVVCMSGGGLEERMWHLRRDNPGAHIIAVGDLRNADLGQCRLRDLTAPLEAAGYGNALFRNGWRVTERIAATEGVEGSCSIRTDSRLLDIHGRPLPLYRGRTYLGGVGLRLPVVCRFRLGDPTKKPAE